MGPGVDDAQLEASILRPTATRAFPSEPSLLSQSQPNLDAAAPPPDAALLDADVPIDASADDSSPQLLDAASPAFHLEPSQRPAQPFDPSHAIPIDAAADDSSSQPDAASLQPSNPSNLKQPEQPEQNKQREHLPTWRLGIPATELHTHTATHIELFCTSHYYTRAQAFPYYHDPG